MGNFKEKFIELCRGTPPGEVEEFSHQKRLEGFSFSIKRVSIFSIIAFSFVASYVLLNPEKYPNEEPIKLILISGFSILFLLIFGFFYSHEMKKTLKKIWKWRKNET